MGKEQSMSRIVRLVCGPVLPACALLVGIAMLASGNTLAQGSPEARQACTPDAMRLCSDFIPDVPKITRCMELKYRQLSPECRLAMAREHRLLLYRDRHRAN
jgi:hypothetical protein